MEDPRIGVMKRVFEGWKARDFDALLDLAHPQIFAHVAVPPGEATRSYCGRDEIRGFLHEGDETYEHFEAEPRVFAVGPTGRVFAEDPSAARSRAPAG
jgi:hypothetical protein